MHFKIKGPFEIPLDQHGVIPRSLSSFWNNTVEENNEGLADAKGCYVFAIKTSGGAKPYPWYVGKTNNQTFRNECFKAHQRNHYGAALNRYNRARPVIFLVPQMTKTGRFCKNSSSQAIDFVETNLIAIGLHANKDLCNRRDTKLYRELVLPGFLNSGTGALSASATSLVQTLRF